MKPEPSVPTKQEAPESPEPSRASSDPYGYDVDMNSPTPWEQMRKFALLDDSQDSTTDGVSKLTIRSQQPVQLPTFLQVRVCMHIHVYIHYIHIIDIYIWQT